MHQSLFTTAQHLQDPATLQQPLTVWSVDVLQIVLEKIFVKFQMMVVLTSVLSAYFRFIRVLKLVGASQIYTTEVLCNRSHLQLRQISCNYRPLITKLTDIHSVDLEVNIHQTPTGEHLEGSMNRHGLSELCK